MQVFNHIPKDILDRYINKKENTMGFILQVMSLQLTRDRVERYSDRISHQFITYHNAMAKEFNFYNAIHKLSEEVIDIIPDDNSFVENAIDNDAKSYLIDLIQRLF